MRKPEPSSAGVNLGLIITPMLDMSFQLLAFFIILYHPSSLEGHVDGSLLPPIDPIAGNLREGVVHNPNEAFEPAETVTVFVKAVPRGQIERTRVDGQPAAIFLKGPADAAAQLVGDTDESLDASLVRLGNQLKRIQSGEAGKVLLECQGNLKHQFVMQVYDVCKAAGFGQVSFIAPTK